LKITRDICETICSLTCFLVTDVWYNFGLVSSK